jgi:predicted aldo/keto reductase-like oxidoreductase
MQYRKIEKNGDQLSVLGYGAMRLPTKNGRTDEKRAIEQIRYAIDHGVNYLDTALMYMNEPLVGRALKDGYREKVKLATKLPPWTVNKEEDLRSTFKVQLENFKISYIDYYLLHGLNKANWGKMLEFNALEFLDEIKKQEKILNAGFSFHGDIDTFKEIIDAYDWDFCMIQYNFLDEKNQAGTEGLEYAASKNIPVIVMEPFRGGNLTRNVPEEIQAIWDEAEVKRSPAEWSLRWLLNHPEVTCVLSGMNEEEHIKENIRIADEALPNSLTEDELKLVERVADKYRELMETGCTGCRYCMPCPKGVDIAKCFEFYDSAKLFNTGNIQSKVMYAAGLGVMNDGKPGFASKCTKCGKCEKHCPQELPIMDLLDDVSKEMEGPLTQIIPPIFKVFLSIQSYRNNRKAKNLE